MSLVLLLSNAFDFTTCSLPPLSFHTARGRMCDTKLFLSLCHLGVYLRRCWSAIEGMPVECDPWRQSVDRRLEDAGFAMQRIATVKCERLSEFGRF